MASQSELSLLKQQLDIAILAILLNIGYYKIDELHECVAQMANGLVNPDNLVVVVIGSLTIIAYLIYVLAAGIALYMGIKGKEIRLACIISLAAFFGFYLSSLINELSNFKIKDTSIEISSSLKEKTNTP